MVTASSEKGSSDFPLRKQAYSNILKILPPKNESFQIKILIFFIFLLKLRLWVPVRTAESTDNLCVCLLEFRFYGQVNPMGSCRARSVYLTTRLLGRFSPLRMLPTSAGSNPRPPGLQSDAHPTEPPRPAIYP